MLFILGKAISGAPIINGTNQLPKPPINTGITTKKIIRKAAGFVGIVLLVGVIGAQAATLTITTTADAGFGSLRQAIIDANVNAEANTVTFNISESAASAKFIDEMTGKTVQATGKTLTLTVPALFGRVLISK